MKLSAIQILLGVFAGQTIAAVLDPRSNVMAERRGEYNGPYHLLRNSRRPQGPFHFRQKVDHQDPDSESVFFQRYWVKDTYYERGNCPILLLVSGEQSGSYSLKFLGDDSMIDRMAKENKAMIVILEHRYFGQSFPVENLSDSNMKYLTIGQALADLNHFATQGMGSPLEVKPDRHPWVLLGASYGGGLVSWALLKYPETFYAGYSSSGTVQAKVELWEMWDVILARMTHKGFPKLQKCASWLEVILEEFYKAGEDEDHTGIRQLRKILKMSQIERLGDMADILSRPLQQYPNASFNKYCEALSKAKTFQDALKAVGDYNKKDLLVDEEAWAWNSYNPENKLYTDVEIDLRESPDVPQRQWVWLKCNELGWFVTAPPSGSLIVSKYLVIEQDLGKCSRHFPTLKSHMTLEAITQRVEKTNKEYGGFNKRVAKLIDVNGEYDPLLCITFQSPNSLELYREAGFLIPGYHTQDMSDPIKGEMDRVQKDIQRKIRNWLKEWSPPA